MARIANTNYAATPFIRATDDNDAFDRDDLNLLAAGLDLHDHSDTRGLPVQRIGGNVVTTTNLQDSSVTDAKVGNRTLSPTAPSSNGPAQLTTLLSWLANRIQAGHGTTNWFDAVPVPLPGKVTKTGDGMTGALSITRASVSVPIDGTLYINSKLLLQNAGSATLDPPAIGFHIPGVVGHALYARAEAVTGGYPLAIIDGGGNIGRIVTDRNGGPGSGVNADLLDSMQSGNGNGNIPINNGIMSINLFSQYASALNWPAVGNFVLGNGSNNVPLSNATQNTNLWAQYATTMRWVAIGDFNAGNSANNIPVSNGQINASLNADMVDNLHGSQFIRSDTTDFKAGDLTLHRNNNSGFLLFGNANQFFIGWNGTNLTSPYGTVWTDAVHGSMDAPTLDGLDSTQFLRSDATNGNGTFSGTVTATRFVDSSSDGSGAAPVFAMVQNQGFYVSGGGEIGIAAGGTGRGRFDDGGDLFITADIWCTTLHQTSDRRLKTDIDYVEGVGAIDKINRLRPASFRFLDNLEEKRLGFIAQDMLEVYPQAVTVYDHGDMEGERVKRFAVDPMAMIVLLAQGIKEQETRLQLLEAGYWKTL